jgi:hypothetical protein
MICIQYCYRPKLLDTPEKVSLHHLVCDSLLALKTNGRIADFAVQEADAAFPNREAQQGLFEQLRDFAGRHKVGLAHIFGSRRAGFWYMPWQFLLVFKEDTLSEVFPCRIGGGEIGVGEYLERLQAGKPWTTRPSTGMEGKKHNALIAQILNDSDVLETGLALQGKNVQVSRDFGELGYVDLVFTDGRGRTLLVEVKVGPDELDKAVGQVLRHRHLFANQNGLQESTVRVGIACPFVPVQYRSICESIGASWFELPSHPSVSDRQNR